MKKLAVLMLVMVAASPLYAAEHGDLATFGIALAACLSIAIAALGGALGQGMAVKAALEGIARNPNASDKIFTPMIVGLALIESLVIYGLVIAFILQGKI
ncbi:MAG: ATP synthase F0 subunit C [SAR324 cluster bacterium]|jgi:F-type H+-transporting ATPase subunit c|nr:ATP synthase F0 subunit C [SAR324 cluster bacterium]